MSRSEEISRSFYERIGAEGLARRTRPEWDERIVAALIAMLPKRARVLDVGCGYGRIALPLVRAGYRLVGVDLSPTLIAAAKAKAGAEGLRIGLTVGSMTSLPYASESFDAALCLWSSFHELLEEAEQRRAIEEMWRVLVPGGFALVEGPRYREAERRISWSVIEGISKPHYAHDERSLRRLCELAGIESSRVFERDWGGRRRLFLRLDRPAARRSRPTAGEGARSTPDG